ncbi:MAG: hypothetical protein PVI00_14600, partial [Desulfobacterales bacterium]
MAVMTGSRFKAQSSRQKGTPTLTLSDFSFELCAVAPEGAQISSGSGGSSSVSESRPIRIVIAGGGTGGHLFPG